MSYFTVLVLTEKNGKSINELLEPYDENLELTPYITHYKNKAEEYMDDLIERIKICIANNNTPDLQEELKHLELTKATKNNEIIWKEFCKLNYLEDFDEEGNATSTYNLNNKWDSYHKLYDCFEEIGLDENEFPVYKLLETSTKNKEYYTYALVTPEGEWHAKGDVGYWGEAVNEKSDDDWHKEFINLLIKYNKDDIIATVLECHI